MKTYDVIVAVYASETLRVRAENEDDAEQTAFDKLGSPTLCHSCARRIDVGDYGEVLEVTEVTNAKD